MIGRASVSLTVSCGEWIVLGLVLILLLAKSGILILGQPFRIYLGIAIEFVLGARLACVLFVLTGLRKVTVGGFQERVLVAMSVLAGEGYIRRLLATVLLYGSLVRVSVFGFHKRPLQTRDGGAVAHCCLMTRENTRSSTRSLIRFGCSPLGGTHSCSPAK